MDRFRRAARPALVDSQQLWEWSVREPGEFWRAVWDYGGVIGESGDTDVEKHDDFWKWRFLPDAKLNMAENLLAERDGAAPEAMIVIDEDGRFDNWSWDRLRSEVAAAVDWLKSVGVGRDDVVAAWMPHRPETVVLFLAAASIGAIYTTTSSDFGVDGVVDRFGQTKPRVLLAADGYVYGGKSFGLGDRLADIADALSSIDHVLVVDGVANSGTAIRPCRPRISKWEDAVGPRRGTQLEFAALPSDHPLYILYSSGTTGKPKCIVHRTGGVLLKHLSEQQLHCDIRAGDRVFYFTTCGWMMWNWLVSCLGTGATIVLYDGNPAFPSTSRLYEEADRHKFSLLGVSAKFIDASMKAELAPAESFDLSTVRTMCSTGSPLSNDGFGWVYDKVSSDVHLVSLSGGTDLVGCLVGSDPTRPVVVGEIQGPCLGMDIRVLDANGVPITELHRKGELACAVPFPSMPLKFWDDPGDARYRAAYFERFPGVWAHGDFASWEAGGGLVIHGRSDATLNASGIRIGTAEIYNVVEQLPEVVEAIAVGQVWDSDTRVILFIRLAEGAVLDAALEKTIRTELRTRRTPRHVPAIIRAVPDIPRTRSGKITELAVTAVVHGRPVDNTEALANPEALQYFVL